LKKADAIIVNSEEFKKEMDSKYNIITYCILNPFEFSKIKKAALSAPEADNSEKIARLKAQIAAGTYEVDYDAIADKILTSEF
jgi:hypothetical protein